MNRYKENYLRWLNHDTLDREIKEELQAIRDKDKEIRERFYKNLEFGTAGLRGIMGAGTNRMNIYTVRKATQGLANYINRVSPEKTVVIAYDTRHKSREFALQAALVLATNNIKTYLFKKVMATPLLSFAICHLKTTAGIMITASHNPREYNGYKVYWRHGGQIIDDMAAAITREIMQVEDELHIPVQGEEEAEKQGLLVWLDDKIYNTYIQRTKQLILREDVIKQAADDLRMVYTPLHGTGYAPVCQLLETTGFKQVFVVPEQAEPDPDFSTVKYPNPEEQSAFTLALQKAQEVNADLIMGTDPDADRVGVLSLNDTGEYEPLTGNQLGALLIDYILHMRQLANNLPADGVIIKTIVTSSMGVDIARRFNIDYLDVLTGFKYIGEKIAQFNEDKSRTFLFGYEESYGFLAGDYVRDKDAVQTCLLVAEMAAYYKTRGLTLFERLRQLYEELGYYREALVNLTLAGLEGQEKINRIIETFRDNPPAQVGGLEITIVRDYLQCTEKTRGLCEIKTITLPRCNVLHYTLEDGSWFCIRPSGTEPKLKIYFGVKDKTAEEAKTKLERIKEEVMNIVGAV
ncbi:phospho-sugar mutase [Thermanaerosceptrum fracticalcis]|uniref:phosphoglucomutase (alpha-D-glucose-1,6-bisphosphate-dependent) n=1 Tax=Thermanaerosceptrum fracticalcis TaxID=1712410 RepID=A0A7G6DYT9_THEFR|nr:phospho-sugar mutase [Thermanaerosceptrum fracticalcis]QNB44993.1 phospho-sugar mutase [Thermanaerosceptrum fracticalcis]